MTDDGARIAEIAGRLTKAQRDVMLAFNMAPSWTTAPHAGCHRRQGAVALALARKGLFAWRYEVANGLLWFLPTPLGRAVRDYLEKQDG